MAKHKLLAFYDFLTSFSFRCWLELELLFFLNKILDYLQVTYRELLDSLGIDVAFTDIVLIGDCTSNVVESRCRIGEDRMS